MITGILLITVVGLITATLQEKPKSNKFRQWWSNHIADMDGKYDI